MSKIDELIKKLCPDGITFKPISEVCSTFSGGFVKRTKQDDSFPYPVFNGGAFATGYYEEYNCEANSIAISGRGSIGFANWIEKRFWAGNSCHVVNSKSGLLSNKFLYYVLKSKESELYSLRSVGSIPALNLAPLLKVEIPVPPIEIQNEIVSILDKFTELEAELEAELAAELEARKKQYEFYRQNVFNFDGDKIKFEIKKLEDLCIKISSGGTPSRSVDRFFQGDIPWVRTQEVNFDEIHETEISITDEAVKKSSANLVPANTVILAMYGATAGKSAITRIPVTTNQACCNLETNKDLLIPEYLFHWLMTNYEYIKSLGQGTQTNINAKIVRNLVIPIPSLETQKMVVSFLDNFQNITKSLSSGLPAELQSRRKQYEYYRNKLLNFKELKSA